MAIHLMTTTGTETDVRAALGLAASEGSASEPTVAPISATVDSLPSQTETPPAPETPPAAPAESDEDTTTDLSPQEKGAQTKGRLQKRIDELVAARYKTQGELEAAQRQIAELQARLTPSAPQPPTEPATKTPAGPPKEAEFDTYDEFLIATARYWSRQETEQLLAEREAKRQAADAAKEADTRRATLRDRILTFAKEHPDYDEVINNPDLPPLTPWLIDRLTDPRNDLGPALGYALAKDPAKLAALVAMSPAEGLEAFGALKAELRGAGRAPTPAPPKLPSAPPPPTPLRGNAVVAAQSLEDLAKTITPGDPRTSEWLAQRNAQLAKRGSR